MTIGQQAGCCWAVPFHGVSGYFCLDYRAAVGSGVEVKVEVEVDVELKAEVETEVEAEARAEVRLEAMWTSSLETAKHHSPVVVAR